MLFSVSVDLMVFSLPDCGQVDFNIVHNDL